MKEQTTTEALGAIAKQLKKIAKELKRANKGANEPLEEVYRLTELGKELVEQNKDECEELSNTPSDEEVTAAVKKLRAYCNNKGGCTSRCKFYNSASCTHCRLIAYPKYWEV